MIARKYAEDVGRLKQRPEMHMRGESRSRLFAWEGSVLQMQNLSWRRACFAGVAGLGLVTAALRAPPAWAGVSPQDGYGPDGSYQTHVEVDLYAWLPATNGTVRLGRGTDVTISQGVPTLSQLSNVLTGAFMGSALVRYGPWSGVLDIEHVGLSQTTTLAPGRFGVARSLKTDASMTRVAPGIGYQVYNGAAGPFPARLDAQVGFAWFNSGTTLDFSRSGPSGMEGGASVSGGGGLVQPWAGLRGELYPGPRWRLTLTAMVQGFGVNSGIWGWGTAFDATWAATKWLNLFGGVRALSNGNNYGPGKPVSSIRLTEFGPVIGAGLSF